jgi:trehalose 6-phosphate synthase/phosphatase
MSTNNQVVIVSTRLPISVKKTTEGLIYTPSSGGLATSVNSTNLRKNSIWVGWPGIASDNLTKVDKLDIEKELKKHGCSPVFLNQIQIDNYYSGYSNATLWPILHYFPNRTKFDKDYWKSYKQVNNIFANHIEKIYRNGAKIWIHDYQLMLLPNLLRNIYPIVKIGFFLHTPFPSYEIFRLLPERKELLNGILGADLIGFHTYDYVSHFLSSVLRLEGSESSLGIIDFNGRKR